jgi:pimeloyl-ACP methyl ester carboxylesterase
MAGAISPTLGSLAAFRLWFRTGIRPRPHPEATALMARGDRLLLHHAAGEWHGTAWGEGPRVLLVHGWGGDASQLTALVPPLVSAGYRVMAYDLPAHGRNRGSRTNVFQAADALQAIGLEHGRFHALVAHSFGTLAALVAVRNGLPVDRIAALAPTVLLDTMIAGFADRMRLSPAVRSRLARRVLRFATPEFWGALDLPHPALIVHDETDRMAPIANALHLASVWPAARLVRTTGLGHHRLLRDPAVVDHVADFVRVASPNTVFRGNSHAAPVRPERARRQPALSRYHDVRGSGR